MSVCVHVEVKVVIPGFHRWASAPERVAFLRDRHRHLFVIRARKQVWHADREVEFFVLRAAVLEALHAEYPSGVDGVEFGGSSCEMIATALVHACGLVSCSVHEDDENGAEVFA